MNRHWHNFFFFFGLAAIAILFVALGSNWSQVLEVLKSMRYWFPLTLLLWFIIYMLNALSWYMILRDDSSVRVPYIKVLKYTVTGFALNGTTPFGLMGGEPYRIMELTPMVGVDKATSSVLLYVMMHISSHFVFWLTCIPVFVIMSLSGAADYVLNARMWLLLSLMTAIFLFVIYLFSRAYRSGFVVTLFALLSKLPWGGKWASAFLEKNRLVLEKIDTQIGEMHGKARLRFWISFLVEYAARFLPCIEYWILIRILYSDVSYIDSLLIYAFSSFFSNLLFFLPLQLGGREGGVAMAAAGVSIPGEMGLVSSVASRVREFVWIVIGILLMKVGNGHGKEKGPV